MCKTCNNAAQREQWAAARAALPVPERERLLADGARRCPGPCDQVKPLSDFYRGHGRCKSCELASRRAATADTKARVLAHYGQVCACCGTPGDLTIDHVNGGGKAHRTTLFSGDGRSGYSIRFWRWLIDQGFPSGFQTLCRRCNRSKGDGPACLLHGPLSRCKEGHTRIRVSSGQIRCRECARRYSRNRKRQAMAKDADGPAR